MKLTMRYVYFTPPAEDIIRKLENCLKEDALGAGCKIKKWCELDKDGDLILYLKTTKKRPSIEVKGMLPLGYWSLAH